MKTFRHNCTKRSIIEAYRLFVSVAVTCGVVSGDLELYMFKKSCVVLFLSSTLYDFGQFLLDLCYTVC